MVNCSCKCAGHFQVDEATVDYGNNGDVRSEEDAIKRDEEDGVERSARNNGGSDQNNRVNDEEMMSPISYVTRFVSEAMSDNG
jgi:hypothetical protein